MYRKYALKSAVWHKPDIAFEWDPEARDVRGKDAVLVIELAIEAKRRGDVVSHPFPTVYEIRDPLRNPGEMAAVLGQYWQLTDDLAAALQKHTDEDEPPTLTDKDGNAVSVDILH